MSLLAGIFIGFLLALPPGGVTLVGFNLSMTKGFRRAVPYAYGTMLADICYALLAVMAARAVADAYTMSMQDFPAVMIGMQAIMVAGLLGYGFHLMIRRTPIVERESGGGFSVETRVTVRARRKPFLLGLALNFSNIFSPTFLAALAILASQAQALGVLDGDVLDNILYAVGFGLGNLIYMQLGMKLVEKYTERLQNRHVMRIQKIAGAAFAVIGGLLCFNVIRTWMV